MINIKFLVAASALSALMAPAYANPMTQGQELAAQFLKGDLRALWELSTPKMKQVFGSLDALARFQAQVSADFGTETDVLSEDIFDQSASASYRRVSHWSRLEAPIELTISFNADGQVSGFLITAQAEAAASEHLTYQTKAKLKLPFEGDWFVFWGGREVSSNYHAVDPVQRFAADFLVLEAGKSFNGAPDALQSYHCWGRDILAPADGVVVGVVDGLPDQEIGATDAENPAGNHVVIDFGAGEYGFLAHLQQNSVTVAAGEAVTLGQKIGLCGNSGNSSEPHLHFHLQTSPDFGKGEGLPAQFQNYLSDGRLEMIGEPQRGETVENAAP